MAEQQRVRRISFIVPVKNDAVRLKSCLGSIAANRNAAVATEVLVADNGSTDDSRSVAEAAGARVLRLPDFGVSELRNRAAAAATGELLAFVDADHVLAEGWTEAALEVMGHERVGAAGAIYASPPGGTWVQTAYGAIRGRTVGQHDTFWLASGNLVVRRTAFEALQGFDTTLVACEDVDLCQRLRSSGWRLVADDRLQSVHLGDPPTLGQLFRAERWRGRDNLKVSFNGHLGLRDLPSALIPVLDLAALAAILWGVLTWPFAGRAAIVTAVVASGVILAFATLRVIRALVGGRLTFAMLPGAFAVALTWDLARALALIWPAPHHRPPSGNKTRNGVALT